MGHLGALPEPGVWAVKGGRQVPVLLMLGPLAPASGCMVARRRERAAVDKGWERGCVASESVRLTWYAVAARHALLTVMLLDKRQGAIVGCRATGAKDKQGRAGLDNREGTRAPSCAPWPLWEAWRTRMYGQGGTGGAGCLNTWYC